MAIKDRFIRERISKNSFDILFASLSLAVLLPFLLLIAFLLKIEGLFNPDFRGPIFFKEARISKGKFFQIFKFSTVKYKLLKELENNEKSITEFTANPDKKKYLSPIGRLLAQAYLDELPQLINVVRGEMSLVGPRPHVPQHYENDLKCGVVSAKYIKAGLFGLMQASKGNPRMREALARMATKYSTKNKTYLLIDRLYFQKYLRASATEMLLYDAWIIFRCFLVALEAKGF